MLIHTCPVGQSASELHSDPALPKKQTGPEPQCWAMLHPWSVAHVPPPQAPAHAAPHAMPPLAQVGAAVVVVVSVVVVVVSVLSSSPAITTSKVPFTTSHTLAELPSSRLNANSTLVDAVRLSAPAAVVKT